jgi:hypothetical protein
MIFITENNLRAAIQIALGEFDTYSPELESALITYSKRLSSSTFPRRVSIQTKPFIVHSLPGWRLIRSFKEDGFNFPAPLISDAALALADSQGFIGEFDGFNCWISIRRKKWNPERT